MATAASATQFIRIREVAARTSLSRSTIYLFVKQGRFPRPVPLCGSKHVQAWIASEIEQWVQAQVDAARGGASREVFGRGEQRAEA